ncbi:hypothetical protein LR48_Vigan02g142700 [Vigna angularis]|uniref:Uncharacterized protein n=1 Tax=Phaseolus angularis TaxID=3914 RepID=A0A0L9TXZ4_PHAAN|nr:hypothetical protein LR48_Vigan02g142700 [Vigna angularis]
MCYGFKVFIILNRLHLSFTYCRNDVSIRSSTVDFDVISTCTARGKEVFYLR